MNIKKASLFTIAMFGTLDDFKIKLKMEGMFLEDVKDMCDSDGSLLLKSIAYRHFDISKHLLENGAKVNVVTDEGYNEMHCLSDNLRSEGALELAYMLLERDVDLNVKDKKYKNSAFWYLCQNACLLNSKSIFELISRCFEKKPDIDSPNIAGRTVRWLIEDSRNETLQELLKKYDC